MATTRYYGVDEASPSPSFAATKLAETAFELIRITENIAGKTKVRSEKKYEIATFGAGCFWHTEAAFRAQQGVMDTSVGYMGGHFANPCYLDVLSRITGHAEVAQVHYDPATISYETLLNIFWDCHDPTTLNRQGPDRGEQYRSVIFYHRPEQAKAARTSKAQLIAAGTYPNPIVTQIEPAADYWLATEDHQQYLAKLANRRLAPSLQNNAPKSAEGESY